MEGECKVTLNPHTEDEQKTCRSSRLNTILLAFTLCLVGAVLIFNMHAKSPGPEENSFGDLNHKLRQLSNIRAAIHLEGVQKKGISDSVAWLNQVDQSHSQGGLELKDNEIVIPHNGLYFVYSQVTFRVSCSTNEEEDSTSSKPLVNLSHTVLRYSRSYGYDDQKTYIPILHSARTACQKTASSDPDADGKWFSAIYMGAVFNLRKGDRLKTQMEANMLEQLEDETGNNFFGVFAL